LKSSVLLLFLPLAILVTGLASACQTVPPDRFLTDNSQLYIGKMEMVRIPESPEIEFIASGVGWNGFQAHRFTLQIEIFQGTTRMAREIELPPVEQPHSMKAKAMFLIPVRDVTWGRRGTPEERMNLHRDFEFCFRLLEGTTEAHLAEQCYRVSGENMTEVSGTRVTLQAFSDAKIDNKNDSDNKRDTQDRLPEGIPGSYLATQKLPGLGLGVLALKAEEAVWTPADSGESVRGTWEVQGELILVRWENQKGLILLKATEEGMQELNSGIQLRSVN
tara:strand:- start:21930 stop:22757 length:828 start_codon:yes stop_codon:yes gene_type:complete